MSHVRDDFSGMGRALRPLFGSANAVTSRGVGVIQLGPSEYSGARGRDMLAATSLAMSHSGQGAVFSTVGQALDTGAALPA